MGPKAVLTEPGEPQPAKKGVEASWADSVSRSGWRALGASWFGWMFDGYETYALVLVMGTAVGELLAPDQRLPMSVYIGGLLTATLLGWAIGGIVAGVLADYIGRKRMLMLSILWYAVAAGLTALAGDYWSLLALRFLTGLGLGGEWGPGAALVSEFWPVLLRGRAAAVLQAAFGVGFFAASAVWLFVHTLGPSSWRYMFVIGILPALLLLYIRRGVHDPPLWVAADKRRREARERALSGGPAVRSDHELLQFTMFRVLSDAELRRRLALLIVMSLSTIVGWWSVATWIPQYAGQLAAKGEQDPQYWSSLAGLLYNSGSIAGYLVFGLLADIWGRKPTIWIYYLGALGLSLSLFLLVRDPRQLLFVAAVNGFFTNGQFAWMPVYLPELFPTAVRGSAISLVFDSSRLVAALGPLMTGWLISSLGGLETAAAVMSLIYVLGLIVTPFAAPETRGNPLPA